VYRFVLINLILSTICLYYILCNTLSSEIYTNVIEQRTQSDYLQRIKSENLVIIGDASFNCIQNTLMLLFFFLI
jgi:hypothetical protein